MSNQYGKAFQKSMIFLFLFIHFYSGTWILRSISLILILKRNQIKLEVLSELVLVIHKDSQKPFADILWKLTINLHE